MHSYLHGSQRSVYKVTPHNKVWFAIMLSKHSRQSSLRASLNSLRLLFESPQSVRSLSGYGSSTPLMSQRAGAISAGGRTDDSNDPREDILGFESEDSISVCESKDTVSIDESKDVASKSSDLPDVFEDKTEKNDISGADTESVAGNCESKNDIIILSFETKEHCICGIPLNCLIFPYYIYFLEKGDCLFCAAYSVEVLNKYCRTLCQSSY